MDQAKLLNFKKSLSESNNILIVLPEYINTDTIVSASTLYNFITHTLKKNTFIACGSSIPERFKQLVNTSGVNDSKVLKEVLPLKYIVTVKNSEKDLEVVLERKDDSIDFVMIPKSTEIDLSKVTMTTSGNKFDTFIFINTRNNDDAGSIYENNSNIFKQEKSFAVNSNYESSLGTSLFSSENSTASETVYEILEMFGASMNQAIKDVLFEGIVSGTDGLHKVNSTKALETILKVSSGKDLTSKMNSLFYGYSNEGLELRKKIFSNIKQSGNLIYSELTESDLNSLNIKGSQLEGMDYLPFGIVDNNDTSYVLSYKNGDNTRVLIQNHDLDTLFNKFKNLGYKVSRSNSLVALSTKTDLNNILQLLNDTSENISADDTNNGNEVEETKKVNNTSKVEVIEQPLFDNKSQVENTQPTTKVEENSPFKQAGDKSKSDSPFQQA